MKKKLSVHIFEEDKLGPTPISSHSQINSVSFSNDNSLMIFATNEGFKIYSTESNKRLCKNTEIGPLSFATTFFKSQIIFFIGDNSNQKYPNNTLFIYDHRSNEIKGEIKLKFPITDAYVSKNMIFLFQKENLLLFDFLSLRYIKTLSSLSYFRKSLTYAISPDNHVIYIGKNSLSCIHIEKYIKSNDDYSFHSFELQTNFDFIQALKPSKDFTLLFVCSFHGNKIHIYSLTDVKLKVCLYTGPEAVKIKNVNFDLKGKFVLLHLKNMNKVMMYNIKERNTCNCNMHDDKEVLERKDDEENQFFFTSFFNGLKDKFFSEKVKPYLEIELYGNVDIIYIDYDFVKKNEFVLINSEGRHFKYTFDRKIPNKILPIKPTNKQKKKTI